MFHLLICAQGRQKLMNQGIFQLHRIPTPGNAGYFLLLLYQIITFANATMTQMYTGNKNLELEGLGSAELLLVASW